MEHEVADVEGLQAAAPARRRLAHALDDGVDAAELAREEAHDAVGLAQRPRAQDDGAGLLGARASAPAPAPAAAREDDAGHAGEVAAPLRRLVGAGGLDDRRPRRPPARRRPPAPACRRGAAGARRRGSGGGRRRARRRRRTARAAARSRARWARARTYSSAGMYGGLETMRSKRPLADVGEQVGEHELDAARRGRGAPRCGAPPRAAPGHVGGHEAHERVLGGERQRDAAGAGAHVERQRLVLGSGPAIGIAASASSATSTSVSVSGRGMSTSGVTSRSMVRKARRPRM